MAEYKFLQNHYFQVQYCEFTTYTTDDGETLGNIVAQWSPTDSHHSQYPSIIEAMNYYLDPPFPKDPQQWVYDTNCFLVISEVLSSRICEGYPKDGFAKRPTKAEMSRFEQGKQELYIVQFSMALQEVNTSDLSIEAAKAEGIIPLSL